MKSSMLRGIIGIGFAFLFIHSHPAQAAPFDIGCTDTVGDSAALIAAINTANGNAEADTINLSANCTYSFASAADIDAVVGDSALPKITTEITINGNGATLARSGTLDLFRLLRVDAGGNLTLYNTTVTGGAVYSTGGGIRVENGTVTLIFSTISGNSADGGGGIFNANGMLTTMSNSKIIGNTAGGTGGGIINSSGGTLTMTFSTVAGNSAGFDGGGIFNLGGTVTMTSTFLADNSAGGDEGGGGIYNSAGSATLTHCAIGGNSAAENGGGIFNAGLGTLTVTNATLSGNTAGNWGGGMYNAGTAQVTNAVISGNTAVVNGGGILSDSGTLTVTGSTLSGNKANTAGGGIYHSAGILTVTNGIVWGNSTQIGHVITPTVTYSLVDGGFAGTGNLDADPLFVNPALYLLAPTSSGDYRLLTNSPAINIGSNDAVPPDTLDLDGDLDTVEPMPFDADHNPRIALGFVDLGAYEHINELLKNGDFEIDSNADDIPDDWTIKNDTGDKMKCDPAKVNTGNCALKLKGGLDERAKVTQVIEWGGGPLVTGDGLRLSAYFKRTSVLVKAKFVLKTWYVGSEVAEKSKLNVAVGPSATYLPVALPDLPLSADTVDRMKVMIKHKSEASKLWVDTASLTVVPGVLRAPAVRSEVLPPPSAPEGFRGGN